MRTVFFYGLFMDSALLVDKGLHPASCEIASLEGYGLRIGMRATVEKSPTERVYGALMSLDRNELQRLYSDASVADYVAERIVATSLQGAKVPALCYILPQTKLSGQNRDYARSLVTAATAMGLPTEYIREIETWTR